MDGNNTSIEFTPAAEIGASFPKYFRINGAPSNAIISRKILASRANSSQALLPTVIRQKPTFELSNQNR